MPIVNNYNLCKVSIDKRSTHYILYCPSHLNWGVDRNGRFYNLFVVKLEATFTLHIFIKYYFYQINIEFKANLISLISKKKAKCSKKLKYLIQSSK